MAQTEFTTSDLSRRSGDVIAEALRRPVMIRQRNKTRLVLMNIEEFEDMRRRADPRRALTLEELGDQVTPEEMKAAYEAYMNDSDAV
jgi:hypothetical protein